MEIVYTIYANTTPVATVAVRGWEVTIKYPANERGEAFEVAMVGNLEEEIGFYYPNAIFYGIELTRAPFAPARANGAQKTFDTIGALARYFAHLRRYNTVWV